ncbi:MAG: hypothetical protein J0H83_10190 [Candidatus Melainabacteria bacterium]|jgi:hypothetical protein|nr:hypothetical protein [Candidatus Melainabacteria bacterium]
MSDLDKSSKTKDIIGRAMMQEDESIVLDLEAHDKRTDIQGKGQLIYKPGDANYREILRHLKNIKPGNWQMVQSFDMDGSPQSDKTEDNQKDAKPDESDKIADAIVPASQDFQDKVQQTYRTMSPEVQKIIDGHSKIEPVNKVTDALPELKNQKPRGWPPGSTWDSVDGAYSPSRKAIVVAEEVKDTNQNWVKSRRMEPVLRHEVGHAVDDALGGFSKSQTFKDAYDADVPGISKADQISLEYFLQPGDAGRSEAFAESVANKNGGATGGTTFEKSFAKTIDSADQAIKSYKP